MSKGHIEYLPMFSFDRPIVRFDAAVRRLIREGAFQKLLVKQGRVESGQRVLDLGCGTARLAMVIKKARPAAEVIGIDADRNVLAIAEGNVRRAGLDIPLFDAGVCDLPCRDGYFDRIFTSLLFHHLTTTEKISAAKEMHRVLKPGGELHIADFGRPQNSLMAFVARMTRTFEGMDDNIRGLLPHIIYAADFEQIETVAEFMTIFGTVSLLRAKKPR